MPITVKDISEMFSKDVFTDRGFYCGKVSDVEFDLSRFKARALVIEAAKGTFLGKMVGGKKGIIVPYQMVQAIGDIVLIKHIATPLPEEGEAK
ncbi:MAG: PRC-barrel domain-containing protein [Candidatus Aenigmarchaeota archaeon]|nr:PRC-barrel domain-containing protein [Candidatus Aenigmarchaeota archaeon]